MNCLNKFFVTVTICSFLCFFKFEEKLPKFLTYSQKVEIEKLNNKELVKWVECKVDSIMKSNNIPAISVGIIKDGNVLLSKGFGVHNRRSDRLRASGESIYQIASDTKKLTGIIVKNLVAEGKLALNDSIVSYLPNSMADSTKQKLRNITLRQLLQHTSGMPYRAPGNKRQDGEPMLIPYTEKDLLSDLRTIELDSDPDSKFSYSNLGYAVVGYLCEQASGKAFSELITQYISIPYKMSDTTMELDRNQLKNLVTPYRKEDRNKETSNFKMGLLGAAGGAYSNVDNLLDLMIRQINAYNQNHKNDDVTDPLVLTDDLEKNKDDYGFGLGKKTFEGGTQYGHGGDLDGFASAYLFSPEFNSGVILLTSSGGSWVGELEKELFYKLTDRKYSPPKKSIAQEMYAIIVEDGFAKAEKWFQTSRDSSAYYLREEEMNNVGYAIMQENQLVEARKVFELNVTLFPKSSNAFDSLGEIYLKLNNKPLAIKYYEKSIALNPKNENAIEILKTLRE